jgi:hypothetical protein
MARLSPALQTPQPPISPTGALEFVLFDASSLTQSNLHLASTICHNAF